MTTRTDPVVVITMKHIIFARVESLGRVELMKWAIGLSGALGALSASDDAVGEVSMKHYHCDSVVTCLDENGDERRIAYEVGLSTRIATGLQVRDGAAGVVTMKH